MRILVVNCGSSSLKFSLFEADADGRLVVSASGAYDQLGDGTILTTERATIEGDDEEPTVRSVDVADHREAAEHLAQWCRSQRGSSSRIDVVTHRVVHGGELVAPVVIDDAVLEAIRHASALAPLHNRPALDGIEALGDALDAPAVAVFDTAFHRTLPPRAARYALPSELADRLEIRRYGFHGLAHRSMAERWAEMTGRARGEARLITCQLGSGASLTAIDEGHSVDTTMGFTPLEGLMMGTRSGDLDPSIPGYLARIGEMDPGEVDEMLNTRSGLLGVSGRSAHMGDLLEAEGDGDTKAGLAVEMFCYRIRKQLGAYLAVLGGADAIVFGGGVGERFPEIRARVCEPLTWCGVTIDPDRNHRCRERDGEISAATTRIPVWVLAPDEAAIMARDAVTLLG